MFILPSCAELANNRARMQSVLLETPYVKNAKCQIMDAHTNRWVVKRTPKLFAIKAGYPPLTIFCQRKGYKDTKVTVEDYVIEISDIKQMPSVLEEIIGAGNDIYGKFGSRYPDHIKVWMEPEEWKSEEEMREWAYERKVYRREQLRILRERAARKLKKEKAWTTSGSKRKKIIMEQKVDQTISDFFTKGLGLRFQRTGGSSRPKLRN